MSDVVAVALISAGSSLIGASVGALTTYKVSLRNAETTIATAGAQKEVELAKVAAENDRLQQGNRENERRNRQSTYHEFLVAVTALYQAFGYAIDRDRTDELCETYAQLLAGVVLYGSSSVRNGAYSMNEIYQQIWPAMGKQEEEDGSKSDADCWRDATIGLKGQFGTAISSIIHLMHADVTRGIAD